LSDIANDDETKWFDGDVLTDLNFSQSKIAKANSERKSDGITNIFMTGVTGFLGSYLLSLLLQRSLADGKRVRIWCLVRSSSPLTSALAPVTVETKTSVANGDANGNGTSHDGVDEEKVGLERIIATLRQCATWRDEYRDMIRCVAGTLGKCAPRQRCCFLIVMGMDVIGRPLFGLPQPQFDQLCTTIDTVSTYSTLQ
jgi:hypothetical protein